MNDETTQVEAEEQPATASGFANLDLRPELLDSLADLGFEDPTPIQFETIPLLMAGHDVLGQAATGTGKTASFGIPIVQSIEPGRVDAPLALVLAPTRELAVQVAEAITGYGAQQRVRVVAVYGGAPAHEQVRALRRGAHVVVATPGRAIDLINRGALVLDDIRTVVLDEADEMLDMGFAEDIETILDATPKDRQTVLFSATMPPRIESIAARHQNEPVRIEVGLGAEAPANELVRQTVYLVARKHKPAALGRIIDIENPTSALVFCKTRSDVDDLTETMNARGYRAEALHGGMDQHQRDRVMGRLRDGTANLLVATDVAARGLDVDTLSHVVNYDVPTQPESYVHRIGRVGRAGREGVAITLAEPNRKRLLRDIERLVGREIEIGKVPTVEQLRGRQLELTTDAVREAMAGDDLEDLAPVLHELLGQADERTIALAAIKLVHEARNSSVDESFIPEVADRKERRNDRDRNSRDRDRGRQRDDRGRGNDGGRFDRDRGRGREDRGRDDRGGPASSTSVSVNAAACDPATWSARSPTRPGCPAATSAPSRSANTSAWSGYPTAT